MNWGNSGSDASIVAAGVSGSTSHLVDTNGSGLDNAGCATTANCNAGGTITTTVNNDLLIGGVADVAGSSATITPGTSSVTFTNALDL